MKKVKLGKCGRKCNIVRELILQQANDVQAALLKVNILPADRELLQGYNMRATEYLHAVKNGIQTDDLPQYTHINIKDLGTRQAIARGRRRIRNMDRNTSFLLAGF